jgi:hypothetical protein
MGEKSLIRKPYLKLSPIPSPQRSSPNLKHIPLHHPINQRLLIRLTHNLSLGNLACLQIGVYVLQRTPARHATNPMTARPLLQDAAAREKCRHVCCAGEGRDGVVRRVDEEDWVFGWGTLLETCIVNVSYEWQERRKEAGGKGNVPVNNWLLGGNNFMPALINGF